MFITVIQSLSNIVVEPPWMIMLVCRFNMSTSMAPTEIAQWQLEELSISDILHKVICRKTKGLPFLFSCTLCLVLISKWSSKHKLLEQEYSPQAKPFLQISLWAGSQKKIIWRKCCTVLCLFTTWVTSLVRPTWWQEVRGHVLLILPIYAAGNPLWWGYRPLYRSADMFIEF